MTAFLPILIPVVYEKFEDGADTSARENFTNNWMDQAAAAVSLHKSLRTIERWVATGRLESRLNPDGRREVLVCLPESPADTTDTLAAIDEPATATPTSTPTPLGGQTADAGGANGNAVLLADRGQIVDLRIALESLHIRHSAEARRARCAAWLGWTCAAIVAVVSASIWSRQRLQLELSHQAMAETSAKAQRMQTDREQLLVELGEWKGKSQNVSATIPPASTTESAATTRPAARSALQRLAGLLDLGR